MSKLEMKKTETIEHSVKLGANDLFDMLRRSGVPVPDSATALDLQVYVRIPGGGDWSNTDLNISANNPVCVKWTERHDG
jgi:hypothetical protein